MTIRNGLVVLCLLCPLTFAQGQAKAKKSAKGKITKYVRFQADDHIAYGLVEGDRVRQLSGPFANWKPTDTTYALSDVKLLVPAEPSQILAMAGNYRSHLSAGGSTTTITTVTTVVAPDDGKTPKVESTTKSETRSSKEVPPQLQIPQPFFKSPSCLVENGADIVIPNGATVVHYEAELVIVIGKRAKNVSKDDALDYVLGVTCGNDVSERVWQKADVQWWRAKGSDTFGPCGPYIVSGINYDDLLIELRLNGEVKQHERTSAMIHDVATQVSFLSQHVTLLPGDLIFTGTSGQTTAMKPGDVVEVDIEHVGVLKNKVVAEK